MSQRLSGWFCGLFGLCGCLTTPLADSLYSSYVLPSDAVIPELEADEAAAKKLALNASLGSFIPLRTGYFHGNDVKYWDFGELTSISLKPMYIFRYHDDSGDSVDLAQEGTHPNLIDAIPGDTAYTPLRQIYAVDLNLKTYRNERITSIRALEDAVDMGLVEPPVPSEYFTNCLVVPSTIQMQTTEEGQTVGPEIAYYRGRIVKQFCVGDLYSKVGAIMLTDNKFKPGNAYGIRRRNDAKVLDETLLDSDLNDDGDLLDTNTIFNDDVGTKTYSGIWNSFDVEVERTWKLGDAKQESDLFARDGDRLSATDKVVDFHDRGVFLNRPIMWVPPQ
jgi:hypothetical protein